MSGEEAAQAYGGIYELVDLETSQIPKKIEELIESQQNVEKIYTYCKKQFENEPDKVFGETKQYVHHALLNAAYHVSEVAAHVTNALQLQVSELEKLDLQIQSITNVSINLLINQLTHQ